jgi:predicted nucleotide-binding protein
MHTFLTTDERVLVWNEHDASYWPADDPERDLRKVLGDADHFKVLTDLGFKPTVGLLPIAHRLAGSTPRSSIPAGMEARRGGSDKTASGGPLPRPSVPAVSPAGPAVMGKHRAGTVEAESSDDYRVTEEDKVFVVHGRNTVARDGMFDFLRAIRLHPIDWSEAVRLTGKGSPYIGEVLDAAFAEARAVVVLMTPDEVAYLRTEYAYRPDESDLQPSGQPRPNVLFEAGMALGRDAARTIMVQLGDLREFSDVAGRHAIRLDGGVAGREEIAARLETAGCRIDLGGEGWRTAGDLTPPPSPDLGEPAAVGATIPQPSDDQTLRVTAYHARTDGAGGGLLTLTNDGSVDLLDLRFELPEEAGTSFHVFAELPVTVFPAGARVSFITARTMGQGSDHFELPITARTADGKQVATKAFVNLVT